MIHKTNRWAFSPQIAIIHVVVKLLLDERSSRWCTENCCSSASQGGPIQYDPTDKWVLAEIDTGVENNFFLQEEVRDFKEQFMLENDENC